MPQDAAQGPEGTGPGDGTAERLRSELERILAHGMSTNEVEHARQVAEVTAVLDERFAREGLEVTLVGGGAIEVQAPGLYRSGDIDIVIDGGGDVAGRSTAAFEALGFRREGRHWRYREDLFVEVVPRPVAGPTERVRVGDARFRVVKKEVVLRDRIVGFKHWRYTGYGHQAVALLAAFGEDLETDWLFEELRREDAMDAFEELRGLTESRAPLTEDLLRGLLRRLHGPG